MLRTLTNGWYPCCYKYRHGNFNVYPNSYSLKGIYLIRGNSTNQLNHKKRAKKARHFDKTNKKSDNYF